MTDKNPPVTTVSATGKAESDFDTARFQITARGEAKNNQGAKEAVVQTSKDLMALYSSLEKERHVEKLKTSLSVQPKYEYKKGTPTLLGYVATYTMSFHTTSLDRVNEIQDIVTNIDNVQVESPVFDVKNKADLSRVALKKAFEKVQKRFEDECTIFGLDRKDFKVASWGARYGEDQNYGAVRAMSAVASTKNSLVGAAPDISINPGKAEINCNLQITYAWK